MTELGVIQVLIERGWISLRQMGVLLGYKDPRGIYPRQKTKRAIPSMKIGGVTRVYASDAMHALDAPEHAMLVAFYNTGIKNKQRKEKGNA